MPDNGYGAKGNSADVLLRLYRIRPDFKTATGGSGAVEVLSHIQLRDPDGKIPFALTRGARDRPDDTELIVVHVPALR
jgi:hypothetical protein